MPSLKNSLTVLISELLSEMPLLLAVAIVTYGGEKILQMANSKKLFYSFKLKISAVNFTWHLEGTERIVKTVTE